jgi:hypothetical protein
MVGHEFGVDDCRFLHGDVFAGGFVRGVCGARDVGFDTVEEEKIEWNE